MTSDAPERIWACPDDETWTTGNWDRASDGLPFESEYVRADLAAPGWKPIETAPKEEMSFLIYIPSKPYPVKQGFWDRDHFRWYGCHSVSGAKNNQPTHWMPLPKPPLNKEEN